MYRITDYEKDKTNVNLLYLLYLFSLKYKNSDMLTPQNYRWQKRKVRCLSRCFLKVGLLHRNEDCLSRWEMDRKGGVVCGCRWAGKTARLCMSGQAWGTYVVCGCCWAGTTARANALTQIVPNLSSLYTFFYSVIYNSVGVRLFIV